MKRILLALTNVSLYLVRLLVCRRIKTIGTCYCKQCSGAYCNMLTTDNSSNTSFSCNTYDDRNGCNNHCDEDDSVNDENSTDVITDASKILTIINH